MTDRPASFNVLAAAEGEDPWVRAVPLGPEFGRTTSHGEMISEAEMRDIRDHALSHAAYVGPALGEDFDLDDADRLERIIVAAKRFERYLIEGE